MLDRLHALENGLPDGAAHTLWQSCRMPVMVFHEQAFPAGDHLEALGFILARRARRNARMDAGDDRTSHGGTMPFRQTLADPIDGRHAAFGDLAHELLDLAWRGQEDGAGPITAFHPARERLHPRKILFVLEFLAKLRFFFILSPRRAPNRRH
ncbi:MAG: hypothetical protein ACE5H3_04235 [Planctomycetota bacterium]